MHFLYNAVSKRVEKSKHKYYFAVGQNIPISATQSDTSMSSSPSTSHASAMEGVNIADLRISQLEKQLVSVT